MSQKYLVAFGGPTENFHWAINRICTETEQLKVFDKIIGYTEKDLMNDTDFWEKHVNFITNNARGYGFWLWKSYLILKTMSEMNDNDILVYADAGCSINLNGKNRLLEYFDIVNNSKFGILSFDLGHLERSWTKMDIIDYFGAHNLLETGQLCATAFILRKCEHTLNLVEKWYTACCSCEYHLIDDSPSKIPNSAFFSENRHDQSIFSVIRKKLGSEIILDETYFYPDWNTSGHNFPIWATRLK
jgi:hypothetical protein